MQKLEENIEAKKNRSELNSLIDGANFNIEEAPRYRIKVKNGGTLKGRILYIRNKGDDEVLVIDEDEKGKMELPLSQFVSREEIK